MSFGTAWTFLAVALPVLASLIAGLSAVDLAYHLRAGAVALDTGAIPTTDTFTFTAAGAPWLNSQWLAQVALAAVHRALGWAGLAILRALLVGCTFGLIFLACRARGLDPRRAAWLTLAAFFVAAVALALRPQLFGMALFALILLLIADRRVHPGRLWAIPFIVGAWVNVHGSFVLVFVVLGIAWLEDLHDRIPSRRLLVVALLSGLATLANPFGIGILSYALGLTTNGLVTNRITEWQPTTIRSVAGALFGASVVAVFLVVARRARPTPWPTLLWLGAFGFIGAYAVRGVAWWPLVAAVAVAGLTSPATERLDPRRAANRIIVALIVGAITLALPVWRPIDPRIDAPLGIVADAPAGITDELRRRAGPGDRVLNPQPWGSWFEFALPENPVAIDSRIELFSTGTWDDYELVRAGGDGWEQVLHGWAVRFVVAGARETEFRDRLKATGWSEIYRDDDGTILLNSEASH